MFVPNTTSAGGSRGSARRAPRPVDDRSDALARGVRRAEVGARLGRPRASPRRPRRAPASRRARRRTEAPRATRSGGAPPRRRRAHRFSCDRPIMHVHELPKHAHRPSELDGHGAGGRRPDRARQRRLRRPVLAALAGRGRAGDEPRGADRRRARGLLHDVAGQRLGRPGHTGRLVDHRHGRLEQNAEGFRITRITLETTASCRGVDEARFSSSPSAQDDLPDLAGPGRHRDRARGAAGARSGVTASSWPAGRRPAGRPGPLDAVAAAARLVQRLLGWRRSGGGARAPANATRCSSCSRLAAAAPGRPEHELEPEYGAHLASGGLRAAHCEARAAA